MLGWIVAVLSVLLFLSWLGLADRDFLLLFSQIFRRRDPDFYKDKVVWITGASQGLGELLALHFYQQGAKLIISSRNAGKLQKVAEKCGSHERVKILPFDLRHPDCQKIADSALACYPEGLDYIVHNAGLSQHSVAAETEPFVVDDMFQLNTIGPIALTQALLPRLLKQGKGQFIVISSLAGKIPSPGQAIYAATKYALLGYFHALQTELADTSIAVTICCPGSMKFRGGSHSREIYHTAGSVLKEVKRPSGLEIDKAVELIALAVEYKLSECWMAKQPLLLATYLMQYCPLVGLAMLRAVGPKRAAAVKRGDGYSVASILAKNKDS